MFFHKVLALLLPLSLAACVITVEPSDPVLGANQFYGEDGGDVYSADGVFGIHIAPGVLGNGIVTVNIQGSSATPFAAFTLSNAYDVTIDPWSAYNEATFQADIDFLISSADVIAVGSHNIDIAHGNELGEEWFDLITGYYNGPMDLIEGTTYRLSYFMLVDSSSFCVTDQDCPNNTSCVAGVCFDWCTYDSDCSVDSCCWDDGTGGLCSPQSWCAAP